MLFLLFERINFLQICSIIIISCSVNIIIWGFTIKQIVHDLSLSLILTFCFICFLLCSLKLDWISVTLKNHLNNSHGLISTAKDSLTKEKKDKIIYNSIIIAVLFFILGILSFIFLSATINK